MRQTGCALVALAAGSFLVGMTEFAGMSLVPDFARDFKISIPEAGHTVSAYALGVVVGAPLIITAAASLTRRTLALVLLALIVLGNVAAVFAQSYMQLVAARFATGLPHGAYFGTAALIAASMVEPHQRASAVGRVMLGLTIATIIGVPAAQWLGRDFGWRASFALFCGFGLIALLLVYLFVPRDASHIRSHWRRELGALTNAQVWLTLMIGATGCGGMFAVYTFLEPTLRQVTGAPAGAVPLAFMIFGAGLTFWMVVVPALGGRELMRAAAILLAVLAAVFALYPLAARNIIAINVAVFLIGGLGALGALLQTRLMHVAGEAQGLAAALNHSAFNFANALGPFLAGAAITAGFGWTASGLVGAGLAALGLIFLFASVRHERTRPAGAPCEAAAE